MHLNVFSGLALIAMGIDLMQSNMISKAQWVSHGLDSTEEDMDRYIMTKHENVMETPKDKTGNRLNFGGKRCKDDDEFDEVISEDLEDLE